ncbi:MAG: hypothetical protein R2852_00495 [Bacteroidia bacterium]
MKRLIVLAIFAFAIFSIDAQVQVNKPAGLDNLIQTRTAQKMNPNATTHGYHILIFNGDDRNKAEKMKSKFDSEFESHSEVVWDEPNFKVYVGAYTSKFECMKLYEEIKGKYQTAIVASAKINYPPLD